MDSFMDRRPCWVEVSTRNLEDNFRFLANSAAPVDLLAIVKADAYGHGLAHCAPAAVRAGARWLGVTSVEEGVAARGLCPDAEILVIGGPFAGQSELVIANRLTAVVWEHWQIDALELAARAASADTLPVHLELDTGMSRQGVWLESLDAILARFASISDSTLRLDGALRLEGLMSHLYAADESDGIATREQFLLLERMVERVFAAGLRPAWLHVGNSAAVMAGEALETLRSLLCERFCMKPMARPGLALYGLAPEFEPKQPARVTELHPKLKPVLQWKTQVVGVRAVAPGQAVGYNGTFVATEPMRVALLAVGYADGLKRALSNRGHVLIGGQCAPIVGRISMDQTVVDVTEIGDIAPGDEVVLLGQQGMASVTAEQHAAWAGTIPWEVFTSISPRVYRVEK